jgi:transcriptional regulator with XRE-family HTH domain
LRIKRDWRQIDLARRSGLSSRTIGRIEHGQLDRITVGALRRAVESLGGSVPIVLRWQGGDLDRLVNARHAQLHEAIARFLAEIGGWTIVPEVSFSIYGERGVIDILAWRAETRTLLVIELKTEVVDVSALLGQVDRYRRLAPRIAAERGWVPARVATWVVVADSRSNQRRIAAHVATIRNAFPADGRSILAWLRHPVGEIRCLSFVPNRHLGTPGRVSSRPRRVSGVKSSRPTLGPSAIRTPPKRETPADPT